MKKIRQVVIIGSGRWAKVLAGEIVKCFDVPVNIYFCASRRINEIREWANSQERLRRIQVVDTIPSAVDRGVSVAFVVNSAYEHANAIRDALFQGYHVIGEKPLTTSTEQSQQAIEFAHRLGRAIFSTNTYRFASYLEDFKKLLPAEKAMTRVDVVWTDPANEERYGERKNYDPRVPVVMDVLPHIISIFDSIGQFETPGLRSLDLKRGGAEVDLHFAFGHVDSHIQLSRVSDKRRRILAVWYDSICQELDFSTEPGIVSSANRFVIDPAWDRKVKPIAGMLHSVIDFFEKGIDDPRLSVDTAQNANRVIDSILPGYRAQQGRYLLESFSTRSSLQNADVRYALQESIQQSRKLTPENLELVLDILDELTMYITNIGNLKVSG